MQLNVVVVPPKYSVVSREVPCQQARAAWMRCERTWAPTNVAVIVVPAVATRSYVGFAVSTADLAVGCFPSPATTAEVVSKV